MAQFKWLHEIPRPDMVKIMGPVVQLKVPRKDGTRHVVLPADPVTGFQLDEVLSDGGTPIDFTDPTSITSLRVDPRVEEIF